MVGEVTARITGLEDLHKNIEELVYETRYKGGRYALRKAAMVIQTQAVQNARQIDDPVTAEQIAKNIAVRWNGRLYKATGDLGFRVGVLGGAKQYANTKENVRKSRAGKTYQTAGSSENPGGDTWYWRFVEFGTERSKAEPFLTPAIEQGAQPAADEFVRQLNRVIDRVARKAKKAA
jgi:HK97 gp10 family phage protein